MVNIDTMIKRTFLFALVLYTASVSGQKILIDKTDPFTNERMVSTDNVKLVPSILQAGTSVTIGEKGRHFLVAFIISSRIIIEVQDPDTSNNECLIKLEGGEVTTGEWKGVSGMSMGAINYFVASYAMSEADFRKLSSGRTQFIKFIGDKAGGLYEIKDKQQSNLGKLCKALLQAIE